MDKVEFVQAQSQALANLTGGGMPLITAMKIVGFPDEMVKAAEKEQKEAEQRAMEQVEQRMAASRREIAKNPAVRNGEGGRLTGTKAVGVEHLPGRGQVRPNSQAVDQPGVAT